MIEAALEIVGSGHRLIEVYSDRMRLALRQKFTHAAIALLAAATAIVWLGAASLATLRGICGGFTFLFDGSVWQGDLAVFISVPCVLGLKRSSSRRE